MVVGRPPNGGGSPVETERTPGRAPGRVRGPAVIDELRVQPDHVWVVLAERDFAGWLSRQPGRSGGCGGERHTEEVTGSIPVSPHHSAARCASEVYGGWMGLAIPIVCLSVRGAFGSGWVVRVQSFRMEGRWRAKVLPPAGLAARPIDRAILRTCPPGDVPRYSS